MARVTAQGIEPTTLQGYIDALEAAFRSALGQDLDLAPETPAGQLVGTLALTLTEADEALVAVGNGMSHSRALGVQLDDLGSLLGIPRLEGETDDEYRARYGRLVARNATGSAEAILAAVLSVEGVTDALIRENATAAEVTEQGKTIGAHSICLVVDGGTDEAVAAAIARSKPVGTGTSGETRVAVLHAGGWSVPIRLSRVTPVPIKVRLAMTLRPGFSSDGTSRIVTLVVDHVKRLALGEHLTAQRLLADVLSVPGHTVNLGVGRKAGTVLRGTGAVAELVTFHGRPTVLTGGSPASLATFHGRATVLTGGTHSDLATLQNITNGTVTFLSQQVTGLDFSGASDLDGVAELLQTALRESGSADLDGVEVMHDGNVFVVTLPLDQTTGAATSVSAAFSGDHADELGLDTATISDGVSAINSGSVTFLGADVTGLDFSNVTDYAGVATVLQAALRDTSVTALDSVEVAYDGSMFVVTLPVDGTTGVAPTVSAAFTGDHADELGLDSANATIEAGVNAIKSGAITLHGAAASALDFSAVESYDDVATVVEGALRGASETDLDQVDVAYVDGGFVITVPLDADGNPIVVSGAVTGDTADKLGLDTVDTVQGSVTSQDDLTLTERLTVIPEDITITVLAS